MTKDIRDTIAKVAIHCQRLCSDSQRELRAWQDACQGQLTMTALQLYEAKSRTDWAFENIAKIKAEIDAACALVDERTERAA